MGMSFSIEAGVTAPTTPIIDSTKTNCDQPLIKGNKNSMIYHVPEGRYYDTVADHNAVYFCTEKDAEEAGYRKSKQ